MVVCGLLYTAALMRAFRREYAGTKNPATTDFIEASGRGVKVRYCLKVYDDDIRDSSLLVLYYPKAVVGKLYIEMLVRGSLLNGMK